MRFGVLRIQGESRIEGAQRSFGVPEHRHAQSCLVLYVGEVGVPLQHLPKSRQGLLVILTLPSRNGSLDQLFERHSWHLRPRGIG